MVKLTNIVKYQKSKTTVKNSNYGINYRIRKTNRGSENKKRDCIDIKSEVN